MGNDDDRRFEAFLERAFSTLGRENYTKHPSEKILLDYVYEQADEEVLSKISAHIATCEQCSNYIRSLQSELKKSEKLLGKYLQETDYIKAGLSGSLEKEKIFESPKGFLNEVLNFAWLSSKKAFYGHLTAWTAATVTTTLLLINHLRHPVMVLESSDATVTGNFVLVILYSIISALGLWSITGLALHGYKAFREKGDNSDKEE